MTLAAALAFFSCASSPVEEAVPVSPAPVPQASFLPLRAGWYRYDFERKFKGVEDERNFALATGMEMVEEITLKQTGALSYCEDGILHDPALDLDLRVDDAGRIRGVELNSVGGQLNADGSFFWTGLVEELGRLTHVTVRGQLGYLDRNLRGGREYDGVYHLIDEGTGREQLARVEDGFYSWSYLDGEDPGFTPWPTLIEPDGTFFFAMEISTVMAMGPSRANYSTGFETAGRIIPPGETGAQPGIVLQTVSHTGGVSDGGGAEAPQVYGGTTIVEGEFPNEKLPQGVEGTLRAKVTAAKTAPGIDWTRLPAWYRDLPSRPGHIYTAGQKTFADREAALALAEAAAAADLAAQLESRIFSSMSDQQGEDGTRLESRLNVEATGTLSYRVAETFYDEAAQTAYVLLEFDQEGRR
jgi:hypothetical protein